MASSGPTHIAGNAGAIPVDKSPVAGQDPLNVKGYTIGRGEKGKPGYDPGYLSNRFTPFIEKKFGDTATGETTEELIKFKSGGRSDFTKKVKLAVLKEFWTNSQVSGVFLLGLCIGAVIATIIFVSGYSDVIDYDLFGKRGQWSKLGFFLVSLAVATIFGEFTPHGVKTCHKKSADDGVDPNLRGAPCIYSSDCTMSNRPPKSDKACDYHRPGSFGSALKIISYIGLVIGIVFLVAGKGEGEIFHDSVPAQWIDIVTSVIYGFCGGTVFNYFVEH
jgi:hypothetical protein